MLVTLAIAGAGALYLSLRWGVRNDLPLLMYPSHLAATGERVPFRDIVEMNQPVAYLFYAVLGLVTGTNDAWLRAVDVAVVVLIAILAGPALRLPGRAPAIAFAGIGLLAVWHTHDAGVDALQRELVLLVFVLASGAAIARGRPMLGGALGALALFVKPHGVVLLAILVWTQLVRRPDARRALARVVVGGALAIGAVLAALASIGALGGWWWTLTQYLPLYGEQSGTLVFEADPAVRWERRVGYLLDLELHRTGWLLPLAAWLALRVPRKSVWWPSAIGLSLVFVAAWLYPLPAGVFWEYHFIPAFLFGGLLVATVLAIPRSATRAHSIELGLARVIAVALALHVSWPVASALPAGLERTGSDRNALAIAAYLRQHLRPGETVQPLDVNRGVVDGMWRADAPLATSFLYDFVFYHHTHTPAVRALRARFIRELSARPPAIIVEVQPRYAMRPRGALADPSFPALRRFLEARYDVAQDGAGFRFWHLRRR